MSYLKIRKREKQIQKTKEVLKTIAIYLTLLFFIASAINLHLLVTKLDALLETNTAQYVPEYDPCDLKVVECAEASELEVQADASKTEQAEALRTYLVGKGGHAMAEHAEAIIELYRWQDVVAIAWKETNFCTAGVGSSQNNCGGIKSARADRTFKTYTTVYDSLWDIAYLLQKPRYKGKTIAEINGTYCYDSATSTGECPNWTEVITKISNEVAVLTRAN